MLDKLVSKVKTAKKLGFKLSTDILEAKILNWQCIEKSKYKYKYVPHTKKGFNYYNGLCEPETFQAVKRIIESEDVKTFVNVGCGFGEYILLASSMNVSCIGFEPLNELYETIMSNLALNKMNNVKIFNAALYDKKRAVQFNVHQQIVSSYIESYGRGWYEVTETRKVETLRFDDLGLKLENPVLFLIDVEGTELEVLRGMAKTIKKYKPLMIIEVNPTQLKEILSTFPEYAKVEAYDPYPTHKNVLLRTRKSHHSFDGHNLS